MELRNPRNVKRTMLNHKKQSWSVPLLSASAMPLTDRPQCGGHLERMGRAGLGSAHRRQRLQEGAQQQDALGIPEGAPALACCAPKRPSHTCTLSGSPGVEVSAVHHAGLGPGRDMRLRYPAP